MLIAASKDAAIYHGNYFIFRGIASDFKPWNVERFKMLNLFFLTATSEAVGESRPFEVGISEVGMFEVGTFEVGTFEVGISEVGKFEAGTFEVGTFEVGTSEVGTSEVGTSEVGTFEVGTF